MALSKGGAVKVSIDWKTRAEELQGELNQISELSEQNPLWDKIEDFFKIFGLTRPQLVKRSQSVTKEKIKQNMGDKKLLEIVYRDLFFNS